MKEKIYEVIFFRVGPVMLCSVLFAQFQIFSLAVVRACMQVCVCVILRCRIMHGNAVRVECILLSQYLCRLCCSRLLLFLMTYQSLAGHVVDEQQIQRYIFF